MSRGNPEATLYLLLLVLMYSFPKQISNLIKGLGDTGFKKEDFSPKYQEMMIEELLKDWEGTNSLHGSMSLIG
jgi:hypothetical protein